MAAGCPHLGQVRDVVPRTPEGCEECLASGSAWIHLRLCLTCGHVGCCDDSPNRHATKHFHQSTHPIMRSLEPGEEWGWCFIDEQVFQPAPRAQPRAAASTRARSTNDGEHVPAPRVRP